MEPVTHILTGACLSRTGLNRYAAYATATMMVAAEFPDIDMFWGLRGPVEQLQHHRGITHSFLGLPFEAALIVAGVYGWHCWRARRRRGGSRLKPPDTAAELRGLESPAPSEARAMADKPEGQTTQHRSLEGATAGHRVVKPLTAAPVRWGVLYGLALLALLSHLLLDYTNSYGLRPFFPFNDRWYAASIMFLFDPVMFALLVGALTAPWLFGLVGSEVGVKKQPFRARGWAVAALLGVLGWWGLREVEHSHALKMAMAQSLETPVGGVAATPGSEEPEPVHPDSQIGDAAAAQVVPKYLPVQRALASPEMLSPFQWSGVMDFGPVYQLAEIDTEGGTLTMGQTTYPKPGRSKALLEAEESKLGRVYMDWSPMPIVEVLRSDSALAGGSDEGVAEIVTFRDPRFMGGGRGDAAHPPLEGTVELNAQGRVLKETLGGRVER